MKSSVVTLSGKPIRFGQSKFWTSKQRIRMRFLLRQKYYLFRTFCRLTKLNWENSLPTNNSRNEVWENRFSVREEREPNEVSHCRICLQGVSLPFSCFYSLFFSSFEYRNSKNKNLFLLSKYTKGSCPYFYFLFKMLCIRNSSSFLIIHCSYIYIYCMLYKL